ncbi:MAG: glycosyltransferase family 39 protein [Gammaproteobacteria bacterium]|nr:glycosyltransferase family 39 protein [Gammaproteobacteria bacterium]
MFSIRSNKVFFVIIALWLGIAASIRQLAVPDEGRYGDITRWMVESGDWLTPRINGIPFFHKPPLLHWLGGGLMEVFGVHIWVMRLVPVFAGMVMLLGMFWFVSRHAEEKISQSLARSSVLVLATSLLFYGSSQYVNHDLLVAAWISMTVFAFADYALKNEKKSLFLGYFAAALALLSKGLIGVLIPGMILLPWLIVAGHWRRIPALLNPLGIILLLIIVSPWLYLAQQKYPNFLHYFFIEQQFDRFGGKQFNNKQPWFFYVGCLLISFLPWLLLVGTQYSWKTAKTLLNKSVFGLLVWWAISVTVFFSLPPSKLAGYILPATPPLAIYIAMVLHNIYQSSSKITIDREQLKSWSGLVFVGLIAISLLVLPYLPKTASQLSGDELIQLFALAIVLLVSITAISTLFYRQKLTAFQVTLLSSLLICSSVTLLVKWLDHKTSADQMEFAKDLTPDTSLVFYHNYYYDIPFMLDRKQPAYWVEDWPSVEGDNGAAQIKDGLRFEPQQSHLLWTDSDLDTRIKQGEKLMILVPKELQISSLSALKPIYEERNFNVYLTGQSQVQP